MLGRQRRGGCPGGLLVCSQDRGRRDLLSHWWSGLLSLSGPHCWALPARGWRCEGPGDTTALSSLLHLLLQENCRGMRSLGPAHRNALEQHRGFQQSVSWLLTKAVSSEKQHKSRGYTWMFLQVVWWSQQESYCH